MTKRKVVVTGACGYIAQRMWPQLTSRYDVTAVDIRTSTASGTALAGVEIIDLTEPDRDRYRAVFRNADAVVHCGYIAGLGESGSNAGIMANTDEQFRAEHANLAMAYNVYRIALEEGVRRVVVASSNHASDYYERLIWSNRMEHVSADMPPRSDNFYGWAKASYELLGFVFASGKAGDRKLEVVQLRIGGPRDHADLDDLEPGQINEMHRGLGAYLSQRDQVQLFVRSIEAEHIEDENGVPFQVFYGVSGNSHNFWGIANARRIVDYAPQDNSQINFARRIAEIAEGSS